MTSPDKPPTYPTFSSEPGEPPMRLPDNNDYMPGEEPPDVLRNNPMPTQQQLEDESWY